jgi:hypothetical protein
MSNISLKQLLRQRELLLEEMSQLTLLLHGSWIERYSTCTRKGCKCHRGQRHGPRYYLVINEDGRQRQKYIPSLQVDTAKRGLAQYKRLQDIVDSITQLNLLIIKESEDESQ